MWLAAIEESNNTNTMTIDELQSSLLVHEQRMRAHIGEEHVLKVTNNGLQTWTSNIDNR